jgi:hypothetical protein
VQENDRVPTTNGDVTYLAVTDAFAMAGMIVFGNNPVRHGIAPSRPAARREKAARNWLRSPRVTQPLQGRFYPRLSDLEYAYRGMTAPSQTRRLTVRRSLPAFPQKQTFSVSRDMSQGRQTQTSTVATATSVHSPDLNPIDRSLPSSSTYRARPPRARPKPSTSQSAKSSEHLGPPHAPLAMPNPKNHHALD